MSMSPKTDALMRNPKRDGNDLPALCREMEEALRLAHAILEKMPESQMIRAQKRAAIKHHDDKPMRFICAVLANITSEPMPASADQYKEKP
jgi:hypothetical protein